MPNLKSCVLAIGLLGLPAAHAAADQSPERINVRDYKDAASLREAIQRIAARMHFHLPPVGDFDRTPRKDSPAIISGKILTETIRTDAAPGVPRLQVSFSAPNRLSYIEFDFIYPTGQLQDTYYASPLPGETAGSHTIETPEASWGNYVASGEWKLKYAMILDQQGVAKQYTGTKLAALFPSLELHVENGITPDKTPPTVTAGEILTPVVYSNRPEPAFKAKMSVTDDLSGVQTLYLFLEDPDGYIVIDFPTMPPSPVIKGDVLVKDAFLNPPKTGTWTIYGYQVCDVPYNCVIDDNSADIQALFGANTFTVRR